MDWLTEPAAWMGFVTLTVLEIVLGIDNIIFISILSGKLPKAQQPKARTLGLAAAMVTRILLLFSLTLIARMTRPLFSVASHAVSGRDLVLFVGGLFLLAKSTHEIHGRLEGDEGHATVRKAPSLGAVLVQIALLDVVFSLDSVITAVGMVDRLGIMVAAVVAAVGVMMVFSGAVSGFVDRHPTVKMLALSFLLMIGLMLVADGLGHHIPKGYVYFAMAFSVFVEMLNIRARKPKAPIHLREPYRPEAK